MSQTQHALLPETEPDVARVARRVLSLLASDKGAERAACNRVLNLSQADDAVDWRHRLYVAAFCPDPSQLAQTVVELNNSHTSNDELAFSIIPDVARRLGAAWVDDIISFADVTIGCARLQSVLRQLPDDVPDLPATDSALRLDCLVAVPAGAQHTLGALLLAKQLRQARHRVTIDLKAHDAGLFQMAQTQRFDMILVSASRGECPHALKDFVAVCRHHWPKSKIVLGGSIGDFSADHVGGIGADLVTQDWQVALTLCR